MGKRKSYYDEGSVNSFISGVVSSLVKIPGTQADLVKHVVPSQQYEVLREARKWAGRGIVANFDVLLLRQDGSILKFSLYEPAIVAPHDIILPEDRWRGDPRLSIFDAAFSLLEQYNVIHRVARWFRTSGASQSTIAYYWPAGEAFLRDGNALAPVPKFKPLNNMPLEDIRNSSELIAAARLLPEAPPEQETIRVALRRPNPFTRTVIEMAFDGEPYEGSLQTELLKCARSE